MCELLGMSGSTRFTAEVTIRSFAMRDVKNADGWGLAWYVDGSLALVKEPVAWSTSGHARFLGSYERMRSEIFIGHVRRATVGRRGSRANAHPFEREICGRAYVFAHNGTVGASSLSLGAYRPIGETDSERVFCHLADQILRRGGALETAHDWRWLAGALGSINRSGKLNVLMSDGQRLFAYRDGAGFKGLSIRSIGLHAGVTRHLDDFDVEIDLHGAEGDRVCVVATFPLSESGWHEVEPSELMVIEGGRLTWSNRRGAAAQVAST
jgi:glutamine amidotransferase